VNEINESLNSCNHEWLIEQPNGPTSKAVCTNCDEETEFMNSVPISGWDRSGNQSSKGKTT